MLSRLYGRPRLQLRGRGRVKSPVEPVGDGGMERGKYGHASVFLEGRLRRRKMRGSIEAQRRHWRNPKRTAIALVQWSTANATVCGRKPLEFIQQGAEAS